MAEFVLKLRGRDFDRCVTHGLVTPCVLQVALTCSGVALFTAGCVNWSRADTSGCPCIFSGI